MIGPLRFALIKRLKSDQRGVAMIEFALALPIVLLLILGAVQFGYILFVDSILEGAVREASRRGVTGYAPCDMTREEYISAIIDKEMLGYTSPDNKTVEQKIYETFSDIEGEPFTDANGNGYYDTGETFSDINGNAVYDRDLSTAGLGGAGAIVVYTVSYKLNTLSGWLSEKVGSGPDITLSASSTVRNEPASIDGNFGALPCDLEEAV